MSLRPSTTPASNFRLELESALERRGCEAYIAASSCHFETISSSEGKDGPAAGSDTDSAAAAGTSSSVIRDLRERDAPDLAALCLSGAAGRGAVPSAETAEAAAGLSRGAGVSAAGAVTGATGATGAAVSAGTGGTGAAAGRTAPDSAGADDTTADGAVFRKAIFISENSICSRWFDEAR